MAEKLERRMSGISTARGARWCEDVHRNKSGRDLVERFKFIDLGGEALREGSRNSEKQIKPKPNSKM